ncbi:MAG TPA: BTAD domain-containing putative transcriptional regulator [Actinocatenispora sp.]
MAADLHVRVLGPLEVRCGDSVLPVPAGRLRSLLALLVLRADRTAPIDELVDRLWPHGQGVERPRAALHTVVRRLRRLLGDAAVRTVNDGYQLVVDADRVDLDQFRDLRAAADAAGVRGDADQERLLLREALARWRGPALVDVPATGREAALLDGERVAATCRAIDLEQDAGAGAASVPELRELLDRYPTHEPLWYRLVLALYRSGERDQAMVEYVTASTALSGNGADGPGPEFAALWQVMLRHGTAPAGSPVTAASAPAWMPVPRQLPADRPGFVGRTRQSDDLVGWLTGPADATGVRIAVLSGPPGVGKTTLALRVAHRVRTAFPDGELHVDLQGYARGPRMATDRVLCRFLRALGIPDGQVPTDAEEQAAMYRSVLAGRRLLVVLDNAAHPDQVRPLLPADPGCAALVTSRSTLRGLAAVDGARQVPVRALSRTESLELLSQVLGMQRMVDEPAGAMELAELCGDLPLALRIAATNVATIPAATLTGYATRLREGNRFAGLDAGDDVAVGTAFELSYQALDPDSRRLFRLLGLLPGLDWPVSAAAALLGVDVPVVERHLARLVAASLLEQPDVGRYAMHDLIRLYAAERAAHDDTAAERAAAPARVAAWYLHTAHAAVPQVYSDLTGDPLPVRAAAPAAGSFDEAATARAWLDRERTNLLAIGRYAGDNLDPALIARLAAQLVPFSRFEARYDDFLQYAEAAVTGSRRGTDRADEAKALRYRMSAHWVRGERDHAERDAAASLAIAQDLGDPLATARGFNALAVVHEWSGQPARAEAEYGQALAAHRSANWSVGEAVALDNLACVIGQQARFGEAEALHRRAVALTVEVSADYHQAMSRSNLAEMRCQVGDLAGADREVSLAADLSGELTGGQPVPVILLVRAIVRLHQQRLDDALTDAQAAYTAVHRSGMRSDLSRVHATLSRIHAAADRYDLARQHARTALRVARAASWPQHEIAALVTYAEVAVRMGRPDDGLDALRRALATIRTTGIRVQESRALVTLASVRHELGQPRLAALHAGRAVAVASRTGEIPQVRAAQRVLSTT